MNKLVFAISVTTALISAAAVAPPEAAAQETIIFSSTGTSALSWPIFGAIAKGFFKENGIALDFIHNPSSAAGMQQLAAGSVNISSNGFVDPLRAIDKDAPISLLRLEMVPAPYEIYAKPNIHSFADLKGKTVVLGGIKDITRTYFEHMAAPEGLQPGSYDMVFAGTASARLTALLSGSVDAAILNPPFNFRAKAAKFSLLPAPKDFSKGIPFSGISVNTAWAKAHLPLVKKFLAAYAEGVDWFYAPANREEAVDVLAKALSAKRNEVERMYDFYVAIKAFDRTGAVTKGSIGKLLEVLKAQGDIDGSTDFSRFYNPAAIGMKE